MGAIRSICRPRIRKVGVSESKLPGTPPTDLGIPPLEIRSPLELNPPRSGCSARGSTVVGRVPSFRALRASPGCRSRTSTISQSLSRRGATWVSRLGFDREGARRLLVGVYRGSPDKLASITRCDSLRQQGVRMELDSLVPHS